MTNPQNPTTQTLSSASNPHSPRPKWLRNEGEHTLHEGEAGNISNSIRGPGLLQRWKVIYEFLRDQLTDSHVLTVVILVS